MNMQESERILKIFNNDSTLSSFANHPTLLTDRTNNTTTNTDCGINVYQGKINLFKLTKNASSKSLGTTRTYR